MTDKPAGAFTPWPWHWSKTRTMQHLTGPGGFGIGVSMPTPGNKNYFREGDGVREANANLIASAPELYAALRLAAEWMADELKELGGCDHSVGICCCADYAKLETIRAALAKAEGREP